MVALERALIAAHAIRHGKVFYGWYIVGLAFIANFIGLALQSGTFAVFLKPMTDDLGWSRGDFSAAQSVSNAMMAVTGFAIGGMVDRQGGRRLMIFGATILGASAIALSQVHELWQFFLIRSLFFVVGNACIGNLVVTVTLSKWFVRRRGAAIASAGMGQPLSYIVMVPLISLFADELGWRLSWIVLGIIVWVTIILPTALIMRRQPEDMGLLPDGDTPDSLEGASQLAGHRRRRSAASEEQWTRGEALRSRAMWLLIISWGIASLGTQGLLLHFIPFATDHGFSKNTAALIYSVGALGSLVCKPFWGYFCDIIQPRFLAAVSFVVIGTAVLMILRVADTGSVPLLFAFMWLWYAGLAAAPAVQDTMWATYFGRHHIGSIRSIAMPFTLIFSASGPLLAGYLFEGTGGYTLAFTIFVLFSFIGAFLVLLARPPRRAVLAAPLPTSS